ncbi:MAG: GAP family protein [Anaerolineae bacterium]|nr:GAP family protein [Anaerolineae bacterium]
MGSVLITILPEILANVIYPAWILFTVLLLMGQNGAKRVLALLIGGTLTRLLQILLFNSIFGASPTADESAYGASPIASTLFLFIGIVFLIAGVKAYLKQPDSDDDAPSKLTGMIGSLSPLRIFLLGAGWVLISPKLWAFTLSAISTISYANLGQVETILLYLFYLIGSVSFSIIVVIMSVIQPDKTKAAIGRFQIWLESNMRPIKIVFSAIFGVIFVYLGVSGLIG